MRTWSIFTCREMIAHYDHEALNESKPARWRELASCSASEWRVRLERALAE